MADLVRQVGSDRLDEISARDATRALAGRGLRSHPDLFTILAEHGAEQARALAFDEPGFVATADRLEGVVVAVVPSRGLAPAGAAMLTAIAACVGWYRWPPYGLVAILAGLAAVAVASAGGPTLERWLPVWIPRGRILGAAIAALCILTAVVLFVAVRAIIHG